MCELFMFTYMMAYKFSCFVGFIICMKIDLCFKTVTVDRDKMLSYLNKRPTLQLNYGNC